MLEISSDGFKLYFKQYCVFHHSKKNPLITLGSSQGSYKVHRGYFKIREKIQSKKPLVHFTLIEQEDHKAVIDFEGLLVMTCSMVNDRLEIDFTCKDAAYNRFQINIEADASEALYGCGEQFSYLDLKGKKVPLWSQEQGIGRGYDFLSIVIELGWGVRGSRWHTYYPHPSFVSSKNYYCLLETYAYSEFNFKKPNFHTLYSWEIPKKMVFGKQDSAVDIIKCLTDYLGKQPPLPDWAYDGLWFGIQGGETIVEERLNNIVSKGLPVNAVWAQDWAGIQYTIFGKQLYWDWKYEKELYPNLPDFVKRLKERSIRFLAYNNPHYVLDGELYKDASDKGLLVKKMDGSEYQEEVSTFPAATLDLTNPETVEWLKDSIKTHMIDLGFSGWMADYSESMPIDCQLKSGINPEYYHNRYPVDWIKTNREAIQEAGQSEEILTFNRAGGLGINPYSNLVWAGDQNVNWSFDDGLATVIPAALSLGFCGIGYHHSDIGGYTTVGYLRRSKELLLRWLDHAVFTPIMRTHEGNRPDRNWQLNSDEETLNHFIKMTKIHVALKPYIKHIAKEYNDTGLPLMRHPYLHYEQDQTLHSLKYQYLFGRDLMVAPVVKKNKKSWKLYLPADEWVHLWSDQSFTGGWIKIEAPLGKPPVFYRKHSDFKELFQSLKSIT